jgi:hypothetical protein
MPKKKSKMILLTSLLLTMAILWLRMLLPTGKSNTPKSQPEPKTNLETIRQFETVIQKFLSADTSVIFARDTSWANNRFPKSLRNPFLPYSELSPSNSKKKTENITSSKTSQPKQSLRPLPTFNLGGIIYDKKHPQAIINSEIWSVGDTIEGFRITKITPDEVKIAGPRKDIYLQIPEYEREIR